MKRLNIDPEAPLAVTMGDPAGIGLDITLDAWRQSNALNIPCFCVIGSINLLQKRAVELGYAGFPILPIDSISTVQDVFTRGLPVLEVSQLVMNVVPGKPDPALAEPIVESIRTAVDLTMRGECAGVVTNPIAKDLLMASGFRHAGHTEFLAELAGEWLQKAVRPVMLMASDRLMAVPLTIHVPVSEVASLVTAALIRETVGIVARDLERFFAKPNARIAVCGLNPHAGESGKLGREEIDIITPVLAELKQSGFHVSGPFSADTLFHEAARKTYDVALAMYHDQALIPFKMLSFADGVNVTLGLPFVRTSPDHGTAYSLAGTGTASSESFVAAIRMADRMAKQAALSSSH